MSRRGITLLAAAGVLAVGVAAVTATTYAGLGSTITSGGGRVTAATVSLGTGDGAVPDLAFTDLVVGEVVPGTIRTDYAGTAPAEISLSIEPADHTAFCAQDGGTWHPRTGVTLLVAIDGADPVNYCGLLDGERVPLAAGVTAGTTVSTPFTVELREADERFAGVSFTDPLVVAAEGGFTDRATGSIEVGTAAAGPDGSTSASEAPLASTAPPAVLAALQSGDPVLDQVLVPEVCLEAGHEFTWTDQVVVLPDDDRDWDAVRDEGRGVGPFLVFGTDGADEITGSDAGDCIVGGGGDDTVLGADGDDVLIGGDGVDTLDGGPGDDALFGGAALDLLLGGEGTDTFDGGADRAICDDAPAGPGAGPGCDPPVVPTTPAPTTTTTPPVLTDPPAEPVPPPQATTADPVPTTTTTQSVPADTEQVESLPAAREGVTGGDVVVETNDPSTSPTTETSQAQEPQAEATLTE